MGSMFSVKRPSLRWLVILSTLSALCLIASGCDKPNSVSSATRGVEILPYQFVIPELERNRTVRLYLPPSYYLSEQGYPVLYLHDGQNMFDQQTAELAEWQVDETLEQLAATNGLEIIVVAVDSDPGTRFTEMSPWLNERFDEPEGRQYMSFLVEVVKPFIDNNYRTLKEREQTAIMGADMGGLISHYALHEFSHVFGKGGLISPAYWYSQDVFAHTRFKKMPLNTPVYLAFSNIDGDGMIADTDKMHRQLRMQGHPAARVRLSRETAGLSRIDFTRKAFAEGVTWLFSKP